MKRLARTFSLHAVIPKRFGRYLQGTYFKADSLRTVDELIDPNSGNWIVDKVESLFVEKDAATIMNLKTSRILNDVYIWGFPNSGAYSSKSG